MKKSIYSVFIIVSMILVACGGKETISPIPATETPTEIPPTNTSIPENTAVFTLTPTATLQATNTPTATPYPLPDLSEVEILAYGNLGNGLMLVTFSNIPEMDISLFEIYVEENLYTCLILEDYPNRWYCTGESLPTGSIVAVMIYHLPSGALVWEGEIIIPEVPASSNPSGGSSGSGSGSGDGSCVMLEGVQALPWEGDACGSNYPDCAPTAYHALLQYDSCGVGHIIRTQACQLSCP